MNIPFPKSRLTQALLWSLSFHIGILLIFSISSFLLPTTPLSQQLDIQLDFTSPISLTSLEMNTNEHPRETLLDSCCMRCDHFTDSILMACTASSDTNSLPLIRSYSPPQLPWESGDSLLKPPPKAYPMKITLQKGINSLILIEDGSSLFKTLTDEMNSYTPIFPDSLPRLSFQVTIDMQQGCIIESSSEKEFTDKRLQRLSEALLKELRFQVKEGKSEGIVQGEILLQFAGTFDAMMKQLMNPGAFYD